MCFCFFLVSNFIIPESGIWLSNLSLTVIVLSSINFGLIEYDQINFVTLTDLFD